MWIKLNRLTVFKSFILLLIFSLILSIIESKVLKYLTLTNDLFFLSILSFSPPLSLVVYFRCIIYSTCISIISFWCIFPSIILKYLVFLNYYFLKPILSNIGTVTPASLYLLFSQLIFATLLLLIYFCI